MALQDFTPNNLLRAIITRFDSDGDVVIPDEFLQADTTDSNLFQVNDWVTVETAFYGTQTGRVDRIVDNPFHNMGGKVAYVTPLDTAQGWTAYLSLTGEVI